MEEKILGQVTHCYLLNAAEISSLNMMDYVIVDYMMDYIYPQQVGDP
jgi:hypothetical protein